MRWSKPGSDHRGGLHTDANALLSRYHQSFSAWSLRAKAQSGRRRRLMQRQIIARFSRMRGVLSGYEPTAQTTTIIVLRGTLTCLKEEFLQKSGG